MCGLPPYTADRLDRRVGHGRRRGRHPPRRVLRASAASHPGRGRRARRVGACVARSTRCRRCRAVGLRGRQARSRRRRVGSIAGRRRRRRPSRSDSRRDRRPRATRDRLLLLRARRDDDASHRPRTRLPCARCVVPRRVLPPGRGRPAVPGRPRPRRPAHRRSLRAAAQPPRPTTARNSARSCTTRLPTTCGSRCDCSRKSEWVVESLPHEERRVERNGDVTVVLPVSGSAFLERLLLRLGPNGEVVDAVERCAELRRGRPSASWPATSPLPQRPEPVMRKRRRAIPTAWSNLRGWATPDTRADAELTMLSEPRPRLSRRRTSRPPATPPIDKVGPQPADCDRVGRPHRGRAGRSRSSSARSSSRRSTSRRGRWSRRSRSATESSSTS